MNKKLMEKYGFGRKTLYNPYFSEMAEKVVLWDVIDINESQELLFRIISTNSEYKQGVRLAIDAGDGYLEANKIRSKDFRLWEDTCPAEMKIQCKSTEGKLSVYNIFDVGEKRGGVLSQTGSCGMLVEVNGKCRRYRCNDYGFETTFDKLVFEIELL